MADEFDPLKQATNKPSEALYGTNFIFIN